MTILFYPESLRANCRLYYTCKKLGVSFHNDPFRFYDLMFYWSYHKTTCPQPELIKSSSCVNKGCFDVTKTRVSEIFDDIRVNPEVYVGKVVRKSERQCGMDERLLTCPTKKEDSFIYRKFIDTRVNGKFVDYRLFYFGGDCFLVSKINRGEMFSKKDFEWGLETLTILPEGRLEEIYKSCQKFGLDFGEIDLLKDEKGKFYVIDINNVAGIARSWRTAELRQIRELYQRMFTNFLKKRVNGNISITLP